MAWVGIGFGLWLAGGFGAGPRAVAAPAAGTGGGAPAGGTQAAKATFAGGCFWCEETAFEGKPGVIAVISGYSGGDEQSPTYEQVSAGRTGHLESVQVLYDPAKTTYAKLLDIFWRNIDPTQDDGQFCDRGKQYRAAIFAMDATQRKLAEESKRRLVAEKRWKRPVVTEVRAFKYFWPAEEYHQDYYRKNPADYQSYRLGCGRDRRLKELWGNEAPAH
jgi:peptide-methionine (S)-S-oxide reductase